MKFRLKWWDSKNYDDVQKRRDKTIRLLGQYRTLKVIEK